MSTAEMFAANPFTNRFRRSGKRASAGFGLVALALADAAWASDMPLKAPAVTAVYDWTGFYFGGHFGYGGGSLGPDTSPLPLQGVFFPHSPTGLIGGYQMGYNRQLANRVVLGIEADATLVGRPMRNDGARYRCRVASL